MGGLDPVAITAWRAALAGLLAAGYLLVRRAPLPTPRELGVLFVAGLGVVVGFPAFSSVALRTVDASTCAVIVGVLPALTAVFARLFGGERLSAGFWLATCAGVGVLTTFLIASSPAPAGGFAFHWGYVFMLAATASAAMGYALGATISRRMGGARSISWSLVTMLPFAIPAALLTTPSMGALTGPVVAAMAYLTVFSQFLGFFAWYGGLARGGIARVGQAQQLQPLLTMAWSALMLRERLSPTVVLVGVTIAALVWIAQRARAVAAPSHPVEQVDAWVVPLVEDPPLRR